MKINLLQLLLVSFLLLTACSSTKIDYDKSVDFNRYKTFAFYKKGLNHLKIPLKKKRFIIHTVSEVLLQKGFSKSSHPDFIVNIFTKLHDRIDIYHYPYFPYYRRARVEKTKEGTFYIDIIDMKRKQVVWSGYTYINLKGNDYKKFERAIYKLLENFPPKN